MCPGAISRRCAEPHGVSSGLPESLHLLNQGLQECYQTFHPVSDLLKESYQFSALAANGFAGIDSADVKYVQFNKLGQGHNYRKQDPNQSS